MPTQILYGVSASLPPIILLSAGTRQADVSATIVSGDVQISKDYGVWTNLATLPTYIAGGTNIQTNLSATEATC